MTHNRLTFAAPPLHEVVCRIVFDELQKLLTPHIGLYWNTIRDKFPEFVEQPILRRILENEAGSTDQMAFVDTPPLPRVWFIGVDKSRVLQLQRDTLLLNWRSVSSESIYPRFEVVFGEFCNYLSGFEEFACNELNARLSHLQYELTYINHIEYGEHFKGLADLGEVFRDTIWQKTDRYLPVPDDFNFRYVFSLPDQSGRLHVSCKNAVRTADGRNVLLLELTARGINKLAETDMIGWFNSAHETIVRGFEDITQRRFQDSVWHKEVS